MKKIIALFFLIISAHSISFTQEGQKINKSEIIEEIDGKEYYLHFVKKGETLFAIARTYEITVDDIFKSNPGSRNGISRGDVLKIPAIEKRKPTEEPAREEPASGYFYHIVKKKETLFGISKKYGTSIEAILKINPEMGDYPREGQTIKIPVADTAGSWDKKQVQHIVQEGETLYGIAKKYNVTIGEVQNANPGLPDVLQIGFTLNIPNQNNNEGKKDKESEKNQDLPEGFRLHEVIAGETLYSIAGNYAVNVDSIRFHNEKIPEILPVGLELKIPPSKKNRKYIVHVSKEREKLKEISNMYRVNEEKLEEINPKVRRKTKKGQFVKIPVKPRENEKTIKEDSVTITVREPADPCAENTLPDKRTYNVALMLPLYLEELDSVSFKEEMDFEELSNFISFRFMDFYGGFRMAVDSLKNKGMRLNVFVYDVDNTPEKTTRVLNSSELSSMDLIIGPLFAKSFQQIADFAKTWQIPIINPLSKREEIVYGNPFVFKIKPSEEKQIDILVDYIAQQYPNSNVLIIRHNKYKYQSQVSYIRNSLNMKRPSRVYIQNQKIDSVINSNEEPSNLITENKLLEKDFIGENINDSTFCSNLVKEVIFVDDSITGTELNLSRIRDNVVIALSDQIVFSKQLLSQLNKLGLNHSITMFGLPDWFEFDDLETSHLLNLNFHSFSPIMIDYQSHRIKSWILRYRAKYNTEPTTENYAFDGFDIGWYFLNALHRYGENFSKCIDNFTIPLIQTKFRFESSPFNGHQNNYWILGRFKDFQFIPVTTTDQ